MGTQFLLYTQRVFDENCLVPIKGLEPLRRKHGNLNPACLPIPPNRHIAMAYIYKKLMAKTSSRIFPA